MRPARLLENRVQREVRVARKGKSPDCERVQQLHSVLLIRSRRLGRNLAKTLGNKHREINENAIAVALDFKVAEQAVGAEEVQGFVDGVLCSGVSCPGKRDGI